MAAAPGWEPGVRSLASTYLAPLVPELCCGVPAGRAVVYLMVFVIVALVLLLVLLSMVWPPDSAWSPWWRTSRRVARIQCRLAGVSSTDVVYDLGCGDGGALVVAAREFGASGVGVEIDPLRATVARARAALGGVSDRIRIRRANFFDVDLTPATVVVMYLVPPALKRLRRKIQSELRPGTRVVTYVYQIDLPLLASDERERVYVYEVQ